MNWNLVPLRYWHVDCLDMLPTCLESSEENGSVMKSSLVFVIVDNPLISL